MKTAKLFTPMLGLLLFAGCSKQPAAKIEASKTNVKVGETIQFTNETEDGVTFEWDFGDGTDSDDREPSKSYTKPGVYTVEMTAYSKKKKKKDRDDVDITVTEPDNSVFLGIHEVDSYFSEVFCENGWGGYNSGNRFFNLIIKEGSNGNEIIIDNLANLGINDVVATVKKSSSFGVEVTEFSVAPGQTLVDHNGRTWTYSLGGITGEYSSGFGNPNCRNFTVNLFRAEVCGGYTSNFTFYDYSEACN